MFSNSHVLGIDVGSVAIAAALLNGRKEIIKTGYMFHHGDITGGLKRILADIGHEEFSAAAVTSSTPSNIRTLERYDNQVSVIAAAKHFHGKIGSILVVGGEKFGLLRFDGNGYYSSFRTNTSCAAGTGSFLDQQAHRLNLRGIEELSGIAFSNSGRIPKIASRCAVFAKTDLIHAHQEGYSLTEICDGLCHGLAKNIVDTLFVGEKPNAPLIFTGGVARNMAVVKHIGSMIGMDVVVDEEAPRYGAIGAALKLIDGTHEPAPGSGEGAGELSTAVHGKMPSTAGAPVEITEHRSPKRELHYPPLELKLSDYPDFKSLESYEYKVTNFRAWNHIEVDIYREMGTLPECRVCLGIDIGSTSTKAVLTDSGGEVLAGFYTRTAGRPVDALQAIFEAIDDMVERKGLNTSIAGAAVTGSGRKFIGKIIDADIVLDEITAHARAARELDPEVDTIIEIGGQDSKFTTLRGGAVTFSIRNNVCAAGTGSFIEEQAQRLGCTLEDYSVRTENRRAPMASDRCTVFMERDINHYLNRGYPVDEILASVLHSVRENYLTKVAIESNIGNVILFQGATGKNKALVAAFEQRLGKPLHVSRFCHLTGALGAALTLADEGIRETGFRGLGLYRVHIPINSEVCELCTNHCKISVADVDGEKAAYGFLCGRDYNTRKYVNNNLSGFDLLGIRKKAFPFRPGKKTWRECRIGIPAALHLAEDLTMWRDFFSLLSIKTVTSEKCRDAVKEGKNMAGAEFCAPLASLYGHVKYLMDKADLIFLPFYLEKKTRKKELRRQYCYYTQFSPSIISQIEGLENKFVIPEIDFHFPALHNKKTVYHALKEKYGNRKTSTRTSRNISVKGGSSVSIRTCCLFPAGRGIVWKGYHGIMLRKSWVLPESLTSSCRSMSMIRE